LNWEQIPTGRWKWWRRKNEGNGYEPWREKDSVAVNQEKSPKIPVDRSRLRGMRPTVPG
jgi:hypothetical protein